MIQIAQGWQLAVERGPGWLFVRPHHPLQPDDGLSQLDDGLAGQGIGLAGPKTSPSRRRNSDRCRHDVGVADVEVGLADQVWQLLEQNFTRRVVLELDQIGYLTSDLVDQLVSLQDRILAEGGVIRICGLSSANRGRIERVRTARPFFCYDTRPDAVMGYRPPRPR